MNEQQEPLRVLVLEDNPMMVEHLTYVLSQWDRAPDPFVCMSVEAALRAIDTAAFDLLIADLHLPDGNGSEVINALRISQPDALSIVFSALNDKKQVLEAIRKGASGYIVKEDEAADIIRACDEILAGGSPMSVTIARMVIDSMHTRSETVPATASSKSSEVSMTPRENEVLEALARGFSNHEIADLLGISTQTIPVHIRNIYRKLEVKSRTEAVFEARKMGLLE